MRSSLYSLLLLAAFGAVQALSSSGNRLLVLVDDVADKAKYSQFLGDLSSRGFTLTVTTAKSDPQLILHGALAHDHLLLLPSKLKALGPSLTGPKLLDFMRNDGNILLALSADTPTPSALQALLVELDIQIPTERSPLVVDHFNYDTQSASEAHDVLVLPAPQALRKDVKNYFDVSGPLAVPRAVGQTLGNVSPLLTTILSAPATAYSYNTKDEAEFAEEPFATGRQLALVSAMQTRNSARFTVVGSAAMLEDKWFEASVSRSVSGAGLEGKTGNREFAKRVSGWTFQEIGVVKVGEVRHFLNEGGATAAGNESSAVGHLDLNPKMYRIKNQVTYQITLSEYSWTHYTPFHPAPTDTVQLEFTMLSPYHRITLSPSKTPTNPSNSTLYETTFQVPDQHGIFNFRVNYKRPFLTYIDEKLTVTVRHFKHNEWPRSFEISGAWVWVVGVWATVVAWVAFVGVWLYSAPVRRDGGKVKKVQ